MRHGVTKPEHATIGSCDQVSRARCSGPELHGRRAFAQPERLDRTVEANPSVCENTAVARIELIPGPIGSRGHR